MWWWRLLKVRCMRVVVYWGSGFRIERCGVRSVGMSMWEMLRWACVLVPG